MASSVRYDDDYETDSELGVDSDVESNFSTIPTDNYSESRGYERDHSAEHSTGAREAGTKAQEASQQATAPVSLRSTYPVWNEVEAPVSSSEAPPPDYEAATTSRLLEQSPHSSYPSASFLPQSLATGQSQPLDLAHQSMSDPALIREYPSDEETGLLTGSKGNKRQRSWLLCRGRQSICNIFVLVLVVIIVLLTLGTSNNASENDSSGDPGNGGNSPISPPGPHLPPEAPFPTSPECQYEYCSETTPFSFLSVSNFSFMELMESPDWISGGIRGTVNVQPGRQDQGEDIRVSLTHATTIPRIWLASNLVKTKDSLLLQLPNLKKPQAGYSARPCMWVYVKIEVRAGVRLENWELVTGNLDINIEDGLFRRHEGAEDLSVLDIGASSTLSAIRGNMEAAYWSSRETRIDVISGSIKGEFALRDLLSLKSQSGSINVDVDPREADLDRPRPAEYVTQSQSGSIKTRFPSSGAIAKREYITRVEGQSSSLSGSYILGALSSFHTASGSIDLDLLPRFDREQPLTLRTDTRSGHTKIKVLTPQDYHGEPWSAAHTSHKTTSTSGSIDVVYPQEWSGYIEGQSISGSIDVTGKDVEIVSDEHRGPVFRHLLARKGVDGQGLIGLKSTSGSLNVRVGE
ncbi:hypothetical protein DOTSEDRAFT_68777 [Dothistroma septosporum NZE10]|uniref:Adhesin domain-containing protein n=1 Tax=Dothistroma septosporum (strain NZE10 / CBS 128990) TaxID=675120 RepID=N1Q559_DOTSN|nr:hypothetical protein DOTSEDRAFT_68777 [Dothistroma septosporum NZE10]